MESGCIPKYSVSLERPVLLQKVKVLGEQIRDKCTCLACTEALGQSPALCPPSSNLWANRKVCTLNTPYINLPAVMLWPLKYFIYKLHSLIILDSRTHCGEVQLGADLEGEQGGEGSKPSQSHLEASRSKPCSIPGISPHSPGHTAPLAPFPSSWGSHLASWPN